MLGPLRLTVDGEAVTVPGRRERAVLAVLAAEAGHPVSVDRLVELLWGEEPPRTAEKTLQTYVSRLRPLLGAADGLLTRHDRTYVLALDDDEVDGLRFESHRRAARAAEADGDLDTAYDELQAALACWHGETVAEIGDSTPAVAWRRSWSTARAEAIEELGRLRLRTGRLAGLTTWLEEALARDPDREELWALTLDAHAREGATAAALDTFRRARDHLADTLGLDPSPRLVALHEAVLDGRLGADPVPGPTATDEPRPSGHRARRPAPPAALTRMLGRDGALTALRGALASHRLVTVTGPGGVGKTRLAAELTAELADDGTDQVAWCSLVALAPDGPIDRAVLDSLGLAAGPGVSAIQLAADTVGTQPILLVLDNAEHVVDACRASIAALLAACPALRVLVTSRVPLGVPGELVTPLAPLPTGEEGVAESMLEQAVVRAGGPAPARQELTELCTDLDGLPLALELAAPMVATLGVDTVRRGLADHAPFLPSTVGLDGRTRDLPGTVSWSESLLPAEQRSLLRELAVYPGSFTADDVVGLTGRPLHLVAPQLAALTSHSLVVRDHTSGRFRLLTTVRAHLLHVLGASARAELRGRHAQWIAVFSDELDEQFATAEEARLAALLEARIDDVDVAVHHALSSGDLDTALRIVTGLEMPAITQMRRELSDWMREVAEACEGLGDPRVPRAWGNVALHMVFADDHGAAIEACEHGERVAETIGCPMPLSLYDARSKLALRRYELDEVERLFREAGALMDCPRGHAMRGALTAFALAREEAGARDAVTSLGRRVRSTGFTTNIAMSRASEAMLPGGEAGERLSALREALALARSARSRLAERLILMMIAQTALSVHRPSDAMDVLRDAVGGWASMGGWRFEWNTLRPLMVLLERLGHHEQALTLASADTASTHSAAPLDGVDDPVRATIDAARAALPAEVADAAWTRGQALGDAGAVRFAAEVLAAL